jgi:hypothetical protein
MLLDLLAWALLGGVTAVNPPLPLPVLGPPSTSPDFRPALPLLPTWVARQSNPKKVNPVVPEGLEDDETEEISSPDGRSHRLGEVAPQAKESWSLLHSRLRQTGGPAGTAVLSLCYIFCSLLL